MTFSSIVRDVVFVAVAWVVVFFLVRHALRLTRMWTLVAASVTAGLVLVASVVNAVVRAYGVSRFRPLLIVGASGLGFVIYLGLGLVLTGAVSLVWWLATRKHHPSGEDGAQTVPTQGSARLMVVRGLAIVAVVGSMVTTGYGYIEAQSPAVNAYSVSFANLPENFDGMTIALVTDLHVSTMSRSSFLPMVVDQINAASPDLIVIAGDMQDGTVKSLGKRMSVLGNLSAPYGVVVTTGNHEFRSGVKDWMDFYSSLGLRVLDNDGIDLARGNQSIELLGINDRYGTGAWEPDLDLAVRRTGSCDDTFCILAAHEPIQLTQNNHQASRLGIDLQLSGHTHGGQIWPLGYFLQLEQPAIDGVHVIDGVTLVTSRGVGAWKPPIRVGAPPEIPLITLHRS